MSTSNAYSSASHNEIIWSTLARRPGRLEHDFALAQLCALDFIESFSVDRTVCELGQLLLWLVQALSGVGGRRLGYCGTKGACDTSCFRHLEAACRSSLRGNRLRGFGALALEEVGKYLYI